MSIIVDNISYTYEIGTGFEKQALKNVKCVINDGDFIGLIGHTGSGKSTFIQHLNGLVKATSGTIYFNGMDIYDKDFDMKMLRSKVGLVFQYPEHQLFEETVYKDIAFGPKNMGFSDEEIDKRVRESAALVGLKEKHLTRSPFDLSGGQKRRVAIAGVLAMNPKVLILDEPFNGLDKGMAERMRDVLVDEKRKGKTILLASHNEHDIDYICDRIYEIDGGRIMK